MTTTQETGTSPAPSLPPPRLERGAIGWIRANLLNSRFNTGLTIVVGIALIFAIWFAVQWVLSADWTVVSTVGGRFLIGNYNSDQACPGNDCFWRPQVSLMMVTFLMGMGWGVAGAKLMRNLALITVGACVVLAFLPYNFERMGMDVRVLLVANVASTAGGWALARYTRFGTVKWVVIFSVAVFILSLMVLQGASFLGIQTVDSRQWSGLQLNLILAIAGIVLSLPIGIGLALGRRSHLPVVKWLCVGFIEVFRGVPLITLLFMSQHLVPLAFPEAFPRNSLFNAGGGDHDVQLRLHGGEYSRGAAGAASGTGGGGASLGAGELADDVVHFATTGDTERDTGDCGAVHQPVQGHEPGLHYRHAGHSEYIAEGGGGTGGVSGFSAGDLRVRGDSILDLHVHDVVREQADRAEPGGWRAVGVC